VWEENKWKLLRYRARPEGLAYQTPMLLVPSLINRHYVLDLMPGKSFAEFMVKRGFDVYCIDWGTPGDEDRFVTFDDVVDRWLGRAIRVVAKTVPHEKVHLLGYCMGGTLTAIHGARSPRAHRARWWPSPRPCASTTAACSRSGPTHAASTSTRCERGGHGAVAVAAVGVSHAAAHALALEGDLAARSRVERRVPRRLPRARDVGQRQRLAAR
jgi:hypothetical protein